VPAQWDEDPETDLAVFRPSNGKWYVQDGATVAFGTSGDVPVPGQYDADPEADRAVFRRAGGRWYVEGQTSVQFGNESDVPVGLPAAQRPPVVT
jgi:hypothetical protein